MISRVCLPTTLASFVLVVATSAQAQLAPEIGYMYPAGGQAGQTVEVKLGGYDWTPDMQVFVHDPRVKLEIIGPPSPVLIADPPYWFGAKARGPAWPLPREFPARLTLPADMPPGLVKFQVANANGASPPGVIHVAAAAELLEDAARTSPQILPLLPVTVNGQIRKIEEVDRYEFQAAQAGPVTIELTARQLASPLHGMLKVHDPQGRLVVDVADTEGRDLAITFAAQSGVKYLLSLHDLDYAGDRSYVYRLSLSSGPRVVAAYPAGGKRGETRKVEFVGTGFTAGTEKLETLAADVAFPTMPGVKTFTYQLATPQGLSRPFTLALSDLADGLEPTATSDFSIPALPAALTGAIETRFGADAYAVAWVKDQKWRIAAQAREFGSPLDLSLRILGPDGKELAAMDDGPTSTDAELLYVVPANGAYKVIVTDHSGKSGSRGANYRLTIEPQKEDFALTVPTQFPVPLGGAVKLAVQITRLGGYAGPVQLALTGLPAGVTAGPDLLIAEGKNDLQLDLKSADGTPVTAALATLTATATVGGQSVTRSSPVLLAVTMKPRIKITPEGLDDVRKVHRGSTFLAPLLIERLEGYQGEIILEMTAKQQRHRQGLTSDEFTVPPDAKRVEYPIFVPEWMETTKSSRMILNGAVKVADPAGNVRTLLQRMELRIGILPEGALLKLSRARGDAEAANPAGAELFAVPGGELSIPLSLARAANFREEVKLELLPSSLPAGLVTCEPLPLGPDAVSGTAVIRFAADPRLIGEQTLTFRATALAGGKWPVMTEVTIPVVLREAK